MADKVTLDFENNTITWDTDSQKGTEFCPDLADRKKAIMDVLGYEPVDFSPAVEAVNDFISGNLSEDEFRKKMDELTEK